MKAVSQSSDEQVRTANFSIDGKTTTYSSTLEDSEQVPYIKITTELAVPVWRVVIVNRFNSSEAAKQLLGASVYLDETKTVFCGNIDNIDVALIEVIKICFPQK